MSPTPPRNPSIVLTWRLFSFCGLLIPCVIVAYLFSVLVFNVLNGLGLPDPSFEALVTLYIGVSVGVIAISAGLVRWFDGLSLRSLGLGFDRPWLRDGLSGAAAGAVLVTIAWAVLSALGWIDTEFNDALPQRIPRLLTTFIFCIAIAVYEEVVFRGYLFQVAARRHPVTSVIVSGILFVGIHLWLAGGLEALAIINTFIIHVLFAVCYLRTRSLWLPIGLHAAWNFTQSFVFGMPFDGMKPSASILVSERVTLNNWTGFDYGPDGGGIVTLVLLAAIATLLLLIKQRRPEPDIMTVEPPTLEPSPPPTAPVKPALHGKAPARGERILAIDVLRGISVLGILPMNMQLFADIAAGCLNPYASAFTDDTNIAAWVGLRIFIGTKDLMVFSMLFGAGVIMLDGMKRSDGQSQTALHFRRMAVILGFGLVHAYAIWFGDILVTYAVCGTLIYPLRRMRPALQVGLGLFVFGVPMLILLGFHIVVPMLSDTLIDLARTMLYPSQELVDQFVHTYRQGWLQQMPDRAMSSVSNQTFGVMFCMGPIGAGMMLVGMGLYKLGFLTGQRPDRTYWQMIAVALLVGFPVLIYGFYWSFQHNWELPSGYFLGWFLRESAYPIIILGWIGGTMLVCKYGKLTFLTRPLAATGQLALSNYLMQSLICSFIYYGHGLGLVGRVDHLNQIFITGAIWVFQLIVSPLWLKRFHIGPAEWLWRSLTIGDWQRLRRRPRPAVA